MVVILYRQCSGGLEAGAISSAWGESMKVFQEEILSQLSSDG